MSKHHDTPAWLRAIQRDGGPVREWHHEQGDSTPFQGRAVPLREVGRAPVAAPDDLRPWGYAPGRYSIRCMDCCDNGTPFRDLPEADKRAFRCQPCAVAAWKASVAFTGSGEHPAPQAAVAPPQAGSDPIVAKTCALLLSRSAVGIAKYGVTLARDDLSRKQWLRHAQEEALDLACYLQRLIDMEDGE